MEARADGLAEGERADREASSAAPHPSRGAISATHACEPARRRTSRHLASRICNLQVLMAAEQLAARRPRRSRRCPAPHVRGPGAYGDGRGRGRRARLAPTRHTREREPIYVRRGRYAGRVRGQRDTRMSAQAPRTTAPYRRRAFVAAMTDGLLTQQRPMEEWADEHAIGTSWLHSTNRTPTL
ncbi:hypothetical protein WOLCODRAFT_151921 [Wolfiporia cocos MD-104 SS10]|uniref:Uncharacterized protein n=1 Tax=Wolfiporia cocos (strain MD-104) TaxID=742152 RepID=A0A2H3JPP1_WOLCO|nr:hypothetical protein WOLCODRAFT_151921 [Wolfiporia cocos MD-104 SS10]